MSGVEIAIVLVWLTVMGGTIGSFLNVVAYRLPAGMSLSQPGSHCPKCGHAIRWYHNVPVFGWLWLRGRCRDCQAAISARYPLVEAATAGIFLLLSAVTLLGGGANLPLRPTPVGEGLLFVSRNGPQLAGLLAYHLLLMATLLPMALIEYDGHPIPWRLGMPVLVVGLLAPLVWPGLHPVPAALMAGPLAGLVDGLVGLGVGAFLGLACRRLPGLPRGHGLVWGPACVGLILGHQTGAAVILAASVLHLLAQMLARLLKLERRFPFTGWLLLTSLVGLLCWRSLVELLLEFRS